MMQDDSKRIHRPECGALAFGADWAGTFFRGDNSAYMAMQLYTVSEAIESAKSLEQLREMVVFPLHSLKGMQSDFSSSNEGREDRDKIRRVAGPFDRVHADFIADCIVAAKDAELDKEMVRAIADGLACVASPEKIALLREMEK